MEVESVPLLLLGGGLLFGCLAIWAYVADRMFGHRPILPYETRLPVPWTGPDMAVIAILVVLAFSAAPLAGEAEKRWSERASQATVQSSQDGTSQSAESSAPDSATGEKAAAEQSAEPDSIEERSLSGESFRITPLVAAVQASATVAVCVAIAIGLRLTAGATRQDLGLTSPSPWRDIGFGLGGMLALSLPVYALQTILVHFFPTDEQHPVLELLKDNPNASNLLLSLGLAAVVAPVVEEFLFRVLLQGWLEAKEEQWVESYPALFQQIPRGAIPITASAFLFALVHMSQRPDPVALFPLAVGLGYLYRQTHRLLPSTIMHLAFNALSLIILWFAIATQAAP